MEVIFIFRKITQEIQSCFLGRERGVSGFGGQLEDIFGVFTRHSQEPDKMAVIIALTTTATVPIISLVAS